MTTMSQAAFARRIGMSRQHVTNMKQRGELVMDGDQVDVEASEARMADFKDPSKQPVADRHAAERVQKADAPPEPAIPDPVAGRAGSAYQQARAMREKYAAMDAKTEWEKKNRNLLPADEVRGAVADGDAMVRNRLEALPDILAPQLAAIGDEQKIRALLQDYIEQTLTEISRSFYDLAKP
jgi:hypothetical protein